MGQLPIWWDVCRPPTEVTWLCFDERKGRWLNLEPAWVHNYWRAMADINNCLLVNSKSPKRYNYVQLFLETSFTKVYFLILTNSPAFIWHKSSLSIKIMKSYTLFLSFKFLPFCQRFVLCYSGRGCCSRYITCNTNFSYAPPPPSPVCFAMENSMSGRGFPPPLMVI